MRTADVRAGCQAHMTIREYLQEKKLLTDGAFGTYFAGKYNTEMLPEQANLSAPEQVRTLHREYIQAGARLIRTNTFASDTENLHCSRQTLRENILAACLIALETAQEWNRDHENDPVFVVGDIGPIPVSDPQDADSATDEYRQIIDSMLEAGVNGIVFETFPGIDEILPAVHYCRQKSASPDFFLLVQICANQHGYTNRGLHIRKIFKALSQNPDIDAFGINCGIGPGAMKNVMDSVDLGSLLKSCGKFFSALPNASFPKRMADRMVFQSNEAYFTARMRIIADAGANIIGGCCGTTPQYIRRMKEEISLENGASHFVLPKEEQSVHERIKDSSFYAGKEGRKLVTVELAPPFMADDQKLMDAANSLTHITVDAITLPDSPSGRTRADSILMGLKVHEETGICTIPHICCRDKNIIAIRSYLLGSYLNGIRNFLVVTGDPIPTLMRQDVKSVFNFDSIGLMRIIQELNEEQFYADPITYGGALNYTRKNLDVEIGRMEKKIDAGASFFMTQPVFSAEDEERLHLLKDAMRRKDPSVKLFCGLMPLVSRKNALFIQNEMSGINVTDEIADLYREDMTRQEGEAVGIGIVNQVIKDTASFTDGYYFSIPFNRVYMLEKILPEMEADTAI